MQKAYVLSSVRIIIFLRNLFSNVSIMKTINEIRLDNLEMLINEAGTIGGLASMCETSPIYISQLRHRARNNTTGKARNIGDAIARKFEAGMGKPIGWMDTPHNQDNLPLAPAPPALSSQSAVLRHSEHLPAVDINYISFDRLDTQAAAGSGVFISQSPQVIEKIHVLESWARKNLGFNLQNIRTITAWGDSMLPTFADGDFLFVDETIRHFAGDGLYIIAMPELRAKRLQRLFDGSMRIISDNTTLYPPETVKGEELNQLYICGRVVGSWSFTRF